MIRTLRVRFFLLVWPLVVVALVVLGVLLGRWSTVEIRRLSSEMRSEQEFGGITERIADSLRAVPEGDAAAMQAAVDRLDAADSMVSGILVVSFRDRIIASSFVGAPPVVDIQPGTRMVRLQVERRQGNAVATMRVVTEGVSLDPPGTESPRLVVALPTSTTQVDRVMEAARAPFSTTLTRRIPLALVIGSVIAALVTLVLSRQLTGRVERLAEAVASLGSGNLQARVPVSGNDEIAELATRFNAMATGLEQSEASRRRMVSDVAHELRTPLTNLIGMVESARDGLRPADRELLDALADEAGVLNTLVDDLRDLALADAGELRVARDPIDLGALARRVAASFAGNSAGVRVEVGGPESVMVQGDERRLAQVLRNLIQNAVTHSPPEGVVHLDVATGDGRQATVSVSDHGPGIPADHLERIWERFWRADPSRSRATGGMGLGLSVSRRLMEAMGGTITVTSTVGEGSTFRVTLPVRM